MRRALLLSPLFLLAACGGGPKESDLIGIWKGSAGMTYEAMQNDASGESEQSMFLADQEGTGKSIKLELREGGKAVFTLNEPINATWSLSADTVALTLPARQSVDGGPAFAGTYKLKIASPGEMSGPDPTVKGYSLTFRK